MPPGTWRIGDRLLDFGQPQELSCFPAPTQPRMADLSVTVAKHAGEIRYSIQNGVPTQMKH